MSKLRIDRQSTRTTLEKLKAAMMTRDPADGYGTGEVGRGYAGTHVGTFVGDLDPAIGQNVLELSNARIAIRRAIGLVDHLREPHLVTRAIV